MVSKMRNIPEIRVRYRYTIGITVYKQIAAEYQYTAESSALILLFIVYANIHL